jgi:hypothetical protein
VLLNEGAQAAEALQDSAWPVCLVIVVDGIVAPCRRRQRQSHFQPALQRLMLLLLLLASRICQASA